MPEVVEVCLTALWLNDKIAGKQLTSITIMGGRYARHSLKGLIYVNKSKPFKINKIDSKGKFLWFELTGNDNEKYYILNRFGLEGEWGFTQQEHSGLQFTITDNYGKEINLYFTDSRNFGTVEIVNNKKNLDDELRKMGPDLLKIPFTKQDFYKRLGDYVTRKTDNIVKARGDKKIIKVLMNQTASGGIGCGLGNYLSVEILYDCKISPHKTIREIYRDEQLAYKLADSIKYVVKSSYLNADIGYFEHLDKGMISFVDELRKEINENKNYINNYHPDVILDKNTKFSFKVYRQKKDPYGNPIQADKIITGRTTYWSPTIQKL